MVFCPKQALIAFSFQFHLLAPAAAQQVRRCMYKVMRSLFKDARFRILEALQSFNPACPLFRLANEIIYSIQNICRICTTIFIQIHFPCFFFVLPQKSCILAFIFQTVIINSSLNFLNQFINVSCFHNLSKIISSPPKTSF